VLVLRLGPFLGLLVPQHLIDDVLGLANERLWYSARRIDPPGGDLGA
jgi:hypothetical protein